MPKNIFDMEVDMDGEDESESMVKVPTRADDAQDEDVPFMPTLNKNSKFTALTDAVNVQAAEPKRDPSELPDALSVRKLMDKMNAIGGPSRLNSKSVTSIDQVKATLKKASEILRNSEPWLPEGKKQMADPLDKVGKAIEKAMQSYIAHIEKLE